MTGTPASLVAEVECVIIACVIEVKCLCTLCVCDCVRCERWVRGARAPHAAAKLELPEPAAARTYAHGLHTHTLQAIDTTNMHTENN